MAGRPSSRVSRLAVLDVPPCSNEETALQQVPVDVLTPSNSANARLCLCQGFMLRAILWTRNNVSTNNGTRRSIQMPPDKDRRQGIVSDKDERDRPSSGIIYQPAMPMVGHVLRSRQGLRSNLLRRFTSTDGLSGRLSMPAQASELRQRRPRVAGLHVPSVPPLTPAETSLRSRRHHLQALPLPAHPPPCFPAETSLRSRRHHLQALPLPAHPLSSFEAGLYGAATLHPTWHLDKPAQAAPRQHPHPQRRHPILAAA